jgi:hypothetical protein
MLETMKDRSPLLVLTTDLVALGPQGLAAIKANGFGWIRPYVRPWEATLRCPISGSVVELVAEDLARCVPIDSEEAQRLIRSIASRC